MRLEALGYSPMALSELKPHMSENNNTNW